MKQKAGIKEAIDFAETQGVKIGKKNTYAVKQESKDEFWANPKTDLLHSDWYLVLNNNVKMELLILFVPADSLQLASEVKGGLHVRPDKNVLNLKICGKQTVLFLMDDFMKFMRNDIE